MTFDTLPSLPREQRWREQLFPLPIVVALITRPFPATPTSPPHSRYLLIKRKGAPYDGQWALVGGKWEFGETLSQAIVREVQEETDLEATFVAVKGTVSERVIPHDPGKQCAHFLIFVCELRAPLGQAEEQDEGAVAWFTREEITALHDAKAIIPSDYAMIESFAETAESIPHVEAEMRAPIGGEGDQPIQLLRFERGDK